VINIADKLTIELGRVIGRREMEEIDRVYRAYPELNDDAFVREGRDAWLKP